MGQRWEFLNITEPPRAGQTWQHYLLTEKYRREQHLALYEPPTRWQIVFRFSYQMALMFARDTEAQPIFRYMGPGDFKGWFPIRLFGCLCFREEYPGSLFREFRGFDGMIPRPDDDPMDEWKRQQRIGGS